MKKILLSLMLLLPGILLYGQTDSWQKLEILEDSSVWASSSLSETINGKRITYGPENLFDSDRGTPWVEGASGSGKNEYILILCQKIVKSMELVNGYALNQRLFSRNNRLKNLKVSFVAGLTAPGLVTELDYYLYFIREEAIFAPFSLDDVMTPQKIDLGKWEARQDQFYQKVIRDFSRDYPDFYAMILQDLGIPPEEGDSLMYRKLVMDFYGFFGIRITLDDVYPGTHYDDTCISEISFELEDF